MIFENFAAIYDAFEAILDSFAAIFDDFEAIFDGFAANFDDFVAVFDDSAYTMIIQWSYNSFAANIDDFTTIMHWLCTYINLLCETTPIGNKCIYFMHKTKHTYLAKCKSATCNSNIYKIANWI